MKKYVVLVLLVVIVLSGTVIYYNFSKEETMIDNNKTIQKDVSSDPIEISEQLIEENANQEETKKTDEKIEEKPTVKKETVEKTEIVKKDDTKKQEVVKEEPEQEPVKVETPKKEPTAWEELGLSEYDYYHKPMWSWARVDYALSKYGSESKTKEACEEAGNKMFEEGLGFSCTSINSYAGTYLGEMLRTF